MILLYFFSYLQNENGQDFMDIQYIVMKSHLIKTSFIDSSFKDKKFQDRDILAASDFTANDLQNAFAVVYEHVVIS